ncbi:hypothetical protein D3C71_627230 [compost metagenome]
MRAGRGADQIIGILDIGNPVTQGLVHGVLERAMTCCHRLHLGAQKLHAEDVRGLTGYVGRAHINDTGKTETCCHRCGGNAVLAGAGFRDDAGLAHALGKQDLAEAIVDLVRAGVV